MKVSIFRKLLSSFVRPLYSIEEKTSKTQLLEDFGEFPPAPFRCESLVGEFCVIRTRGIGAIYQDLVIMKKFIRAIDLNAQIISSDVIELIGGADFVHTLNKTLNGFGQNTRLIKPVLISLTLSMLAVKLIAQSISSSASKSKLGCFIPLYKDEANIIIKAGRCNHELELSVIAHEHIHMLQHRRRERHSRDVRCPQVLLSESQPRLTFYLYLLKKDEVEARLHESVVSFYRTRRYLPATESEFLELLAFNQKYGWLVSGTLKQQGIKLHREMDIYPEREGMFAEQLEDILLAIKTPELMCRFVTEVLPVMYGNLLICYGDETASHNFLVNIVRPNLYDELYGVQVV